MKYEKPTDSAVRFAAAPVPCPKSAKALFCSQFLACVFLMASIAAASAATHYIISGGTGNQSGSDWGNALPGIPSIQIRGDTYYIASGSYGASTFTTPVSGSTYVYFRKATTTDHGAEPGWQASYGAGPAVFSSGGVCWDIRTGYLSFEGQTGSGSNNYGIKLTSAYTGLTQVAGLSVYYGIAAPNNILNHVEIQVTGPDVDGNHYGNCVGIGQSDNWQFLNCYFHDADAWMMINCNNALIDHCYFRNAGSNYGADHGAGLFLTGANIIIRYCVFNNLIGSASVTYIKPDGQGLVGQNMQVYGNVFFDTDPQAHSTQWANLSVTAQNYMTGLRFYNNSSFGLKGPIGVSCTGGHTTPVAGGNNVVENNLWVNCPYSDGMPDVNAVDHNITYGVASGPNFGDLPWTGQFLDAANGDLHLVTDTANGVALSSPFNIDPDSNSRVIGAWSVGAYQYVGTSSTPPPTAPAPQISISGNGGFGAITVGQTATVSLTVQNTGGGTLTGTASTSAPFSVINGSSFNVAAGGSQTVAVQYSPSIAGTDSQMLAFSVSNSGVVGATLNLTGQATNSAPSGTSGSPSPSSGDALSFGADSGVINAPFSVSSGTISQAVTTDIAGAGRAVYTFTIASAGDYVIRASVNAPALWANSFFLDIDADPQDSTMAWDILPPTSGFENRLVSWRGNGTTDNDLITPKVFTLSQGQHQLIVLGREAGTQLSSISFVQVPRPPANLRIVQSQ
jgi:hypothetical protein